MNSLEQCASELWDARLNGTHCEPLVEHLSVAEAYSIQNACTQFAPVPESVVGYKIGATSKETLDFLGLEEPFHGPLYDSAFSTNDGLSERLALPLLTQHYSRVEAEFVACMKNDIARGNGDADVLIDDIVEHIDWIAPGLEIVASRYSGTMEKAGTLAIADFGGNQHMVVGAPLQQWRELDLSSHPVKLTIDNQPDVHGHSGMSLYGNPLEFVCWLLNQPAMHEAGLKSGQIVSCGTCTGAPFINIGDKIDAHYGVLGQLSIEITAPAPA